MSTCIEITELIQQWKLGDNISEERLFSATYQQFRAIAKGALVKQKKLREKTINLEDIIHSTTSLVHDAYLKLNATKTIDIKNRKEFYLLVAKSMRHILVDYFRMRSSQKRNVDNAQYDYHELPTMVEGVEPYIKLDEAIDSLQREHVRPCEILQLKHFFGMANNQISALINVSESTIEKDLKFARGWITLYMNQV